MGKIFFYDSFKLSFDFYFFKKIFNLASEFFTTTVTKYFFIFIYNLFFYSISVISLAKALTLAFVSPIFVTILSAFLLKEKVGFHRWFAVFVGFIGVLIIIQPGIIKINLASIASLGAGISYAFYIISTRKLTSFDNPFLTLIFTGVFGAIIISIIVPFYWTTPNLYQWILMISLAAVGTFAHFCLILSLNYAEASKLAPFGYFEIVNNVLIGYYFFGDFPNKWLWLGLLFIVSSGIYISFRETRNLK